MGSGVKGVSATIDGRSADRQCIGVEGHGNDEGGIGVQGTAQTERETGTGVRGIGPSFGVHGTCSGNQNFTGSGVFGENDKGFGVQGRSTISTGVSGHSQSGFGVHGT